MAETSSDATYQLSQAQTQQEESSETVPMEISVDGAVSSQQQLQQSQDATSEHGNDEFEKLVNEHHGDSEEDDDSDDEVAADGKTKVNPSAASGAEDAELSSDDGSDDEDESDNDDADGSNPNLVNQLDALASDMKKWAKSKKVKVVVGHHDESSEDSENTEEDEDSDVDLDDPTSSSSGVQDGTQPKKRKISKLVKNRRKMKRISQFAKNNHRILAAAAFKRVYKSIHDNIVLKDLALSRTGSKCAYDKIQFQKGSMGLLQSWAESVIRETLANAYYLEGRPNGKSTMTGDVLANFLRVINSANRSTSLQVVANLAQFRNL